MNKQNKNRNRSIDIENKLMVAKGDEVGGWEFKKEKSVVLLMPL